ncbi:MAG TPA: hypothetical protein VFW85_01285 [Gaiellaceae bacterium]|nr:hypothetical protein [Gaiellaceae bacterium]
MLVAGMACSHSNSARKTPGAPAHTATAAPSPTPTPSLASQIGVEANLPDDDPIDLAQRYGRTTTKAAASKAFAGEGNVGDTRQFTVLKLTGSALSGDTPPNVVTITATLRAKSAHAYFYEDNALSVSTADVQSAADQFESSVWPTVTGAFGLPPIPGVDRDPRIIVLQSDLGGGVGGYFSEDDEYLKSVRPLSNEAEMVYLSRTLTPGGAAFNVVLAHEFQHLIHFRDDRDEDAWVNEGLAEDASMLVGGAASTIDSFQSSPQTQLNNWDTDNALPHYGAGAAFFRYLASRFGGDASYGTIAKEPGDGGAGVDEFLAAEGQKLRFPGVFADWIAANILNDPSGAYANPAHPVKMRIDKTLAAGTPAHGSATQFGTDYYRLQLAAGQNVLTFSGDATVPVIAAQSQAAGPMFWGNARDSIDTTLTREVDLTGATAPVLTFKTWFDIERWFDWGYASVSTDGGATWSALQGQATSTDNPLHTAFGPGYTGKSGGGVTPAWADERIDLARYSGQKVLLRFEYITDGETHGQGIAVANLAISGAPSAGDVTSGWKSDGWVRLDHNLDQTYVVRLIEKLKDGSSKVEDVPLDGSGQGRLSFSAADIQQATLAIVGTTEGTTQKPQYTVTLSGP